MMWIVFFNTGNFDLGVKKMKVESYLDDGTKISIIFNNTPKKEKIEKIMDLIELMSNTEVETTSNFDYKNNTTSILDLLINTVYDKYRYNYFTIGNVMTCLIDYYGDNIHKSTIATYLTRLVDQKLLIRVGKRGSYKYKITQYGLNQLYVNEKSI